jgi:hypothetical protein
MVRLADATAAHPKTNMKVQSDHLKDGETRGKLRKQLANMFYIIPSYPVEEFGLKLSPVPVVLKFGLLSP